MRRAGITDILDLRGEPSQGEHSMASLYAGTGIRYFYDPMTDTGGHQPASVYARGIEIMKLVLSYPGRKILVHCRGGQYRSPSMIYAYLRRFGGMNAQQAWATILRARPSANRQYVQSADDALATIRLRPSGVGLLSVISLGAFGLYSSS